MTPVWNICYHLAALILCLCSDKRHHRNTAAWFGLQRPILPSNHDSRILSLHKHDVCLRVGLEQLLHLQAQELVVVSNNKGIRCAKVGVVGNSPVLTFDVSNIIALA